ncbi:MAG: glycosyltransferase [Chloroflexi bacterium]|nr:glycosyltransferase [Chloroflexota bacterium]
MSAELPLITIITPVYNGAKYLPALIESVAAQDYPHIEHLVIDDGSDDDGVTIAILKQYPHLRWWSRENRGQYATMNEGLDAAKGEIICFISADDLMAPGAVKAVVDEFLAHPEYDGVYGKMLWINEDGSLHRAQEVVTHAPLWFHRYKTFISHCSLYMKKSVLLQHDLYFDTTLRLVGDFDWIIRITEAPIRIGYLDRVLSKVRFHAGQASQMNTPAMNRESNLIYQRYRINQGLVKITLFVFHWITIFRILWGGLTSGGITAIRAMIAEKFIKNT